MKKLLSIVTICYNSEKTIKNTLDSIIPQLDDDIEYIIIDGASTDKSLDIINECVDTYAAKNITIFSEPDRGPCHAYIKGVARAKGEWILFINSDDILRKGIVEKMRMYFDKDKDFDAICGSIRFFVVHKGTFYSKVYTSNVSTKMSIGAHQPTSFIKRSTYKKLGKFNEKYEYVFDMEYFIRMVENKCKIKCIREVVTDFSMLGISSVKFWGLGYFVVSMEYGFPVYESLKLLVRRFLRFTKERIYANTIYRNNPELQWIKAFKLKPTKDNIPAGIMSIKD